MNKSIVLLLFVGCGPSNGVQSFAFALGPSSDLTVPNAAQLGTTLQVTDLAHAQGRCDTDVAAKTVQVAITGLPPIAPLGATTGPYYRFALVMSPSPIVPQHASLWRWLWPIATAYAHSGGEEIEYGHLEPNQVGVATLAVTNGPADLTRVAGGMVEIVISTDQGLAVYPILEGEVGNLPDLPATAAPAPAGHHH